MFGLRMLPPALAAPFMGALADRYPRRLVMIAADVVRVGFVASSAAVLYVGWSVYIVYALLAVVSIAGTASRPAQAALLPALTRTPDELTAANAVSSMVTNVVALAGPAIGGVLVAATSDDVALLASAGTYAVSVALLAGVREPARQGAEAEKPGIRGVLDDLAEGGRTLVVERQVGILVALFGAQVVVAGVFFVLVNGLAFEVFETGEEGLGVLLSAMGAGGVVGSLVALGLAGSRLSRSLAIGVVLWGAPIALLAFWQTTTGALVLIAIIGFANTLVDVSTFTLLQRAVANDVLARVFGILESVMYATSVCGALLAAVLVSVLDFDLVLVITGAFLPILVAVTWRVLRDLDDRAPSLAERLALLRGVSFLALLPVAVREHLAGALEPEHADAGEPIVRQGEPGHQFYVVVEGEVAVDVDGQQVDAGGPGYSFGEIALLRSRTRTVTVTARTDVDLVALDRDEFLSAVTGHKESAKAAAAVVAARLGAYRPAPLTL